MRPRWAPLRRARCLRPRLRRPRRVRLPTVIRRVRVVLPRRVRRPRVLCLRLRQVRPRTDIRKVPTPARAPTPAPVPCPVRRLRPALRGCRRLRVPGTSPMRRRARRRRRPDGVPRRRRLRRVPPGLRGRGRGACLRLRPRPVVRVGTFLRSSCRRSVPTGRRARPDRRPRARRLRPAHRIRRAPPTRPVRLRVMSTTPPRCWPTRARWAQVGACRSLLAPLVFRARPARRRFGAPPVARVPLAHRSLQAPRASMPPPARLPWARPARRLLRPRRPPAHSVSRAPPAWRRAPPSRRCRPRPGRCLRRLGRVGPVSSRRTVTRRSLSRRGSRRWAPATRPFFGTVRRTGRSSS